MSIDPVPNDNKLINSCWKEVMDKYQHPSVIRSSWQVVNTLVPYFLLWYLISLSLDVSYWLVAGLIILAAGFLVRIFIILHDCGHGSFLKNRQAANCLGFIAGVLTFTPYYHWRWEHALHHGTSGDLDRRGTGDIWTLTVREYLEASRWKRCAYRLVRNPIVLLVVAPFYLFFLHQRIPSRQAPPRERHSVYWTNLAIVLVALVMSVLLGFKTYLIIQISIMMLAGSAGIWLFYVQHQFEGVYWEHHEHWDYVTAALQGSSFYKLPKILQWFTGNIGFHHIHHLGPRIPNYYLEKCYMEVPLFQTVRPITLLSSLKSLTLRLWDEQGKRLVGFRYLARILQKSSQ
jgi:acyl-lipid omega-6 desaturase (Delta-12 desaturase)